MENGGPGTVNQNNNHNKPQENRRTDIETIIPKNARKYTGQLSADIKSFLDGKYIKIMNFKLKYEESNLLLDNILVNKTIQSHLKFL